eukprot:GFKZ01012564.1.p1 GENE.GFKZ01012564.1~~GFKZ01012564.1.p1  ORF type:complete len:544 (-),score=45.77 GFKZ01012564.1:3010-4536(-)
MSDPPNPHDLAKHLVEHNRKRTLELYGTNANPVIQFPPGVIKHGLVNLGLTPSYRDAYHASRSRKRPRPPSKSSPQATPPDPQHITSDTQLPDHARDDAPSAPRQEASSAKAAVVQAPLARGGSRLVSVEKDEAHDSDKEGGGAGAGRQVAVVESGGRAARLAHPVSNDGALAVALAEDRPSWHPPWKMFRGISGHLGWVRSVAVDPSNEWFATGSADRTVKIWDLASGRLRLTLTGHISAVRGIAISSRHPYMFTVGEDKTVKCWDLEQNKVIRNYHGHLSGVYCVSLHPSLDVLMTGGRDSTIRVWDIRTRAQVFVLGSHRDTVNAVFTQAVDPQIVSASVDSTIRLWDLAAGKCSGILTNHKKGVRALAPNPREFSFASASADNIKTWALPDGTFMRNLSGEHHEKLVNALAVNEDGVLVSGGDDGSVSFWDYAGAHCFQTEQTVVQPGSLACEAGIYAMTFDRSGSRLITCEADKTIKMWKEDSSATEQTHPLKWTPDLNPKRY